MGRLGAVPLRERLLQVDQVAAELELRLGLTAQRLERLDLLGRERPRHLVDDAEGPERVASGVTSGAPA